MRALSMSDAFVHEMGGTCCVANSCSACWAKGSLQGAAQESAMMRGSRHIGIGALANKNFMPNTRAHAVMRFFTGVSKRNVDGDGGCIATAKEKQMVSRQETAFENKDSLSGFPVLA